MILLYYMDTQEKTFDHAKASIGDKILIIGERTK